MVDNRDWKKLNWMAKVTEKVDKSTKNKNKMIIKGVAITASTSRNGVTYEASELASSAITLKGKPLMKDHSGSVRDIVGRVTSSIWNSSTQAIEFIATVLDKDIQHMLKDGRITDVSIGASVKDLQKQEDGTVKAIGIEFLELSLVAIPGIVDQGITSINQAIEKNLILKEKVMGKDIDSNNIGKIDLKALETLTTSVKELEAKILSNSEIKLIEVRL